MLHGVRARLLGQSCVSVTMCDTLRVNSVRMEKVSLRSRADQRHNFGDQSNATQVKPMSGTLYNAVAIVIFVFVAANFLFPCNSIMPLDRRTTSVLGAVLCYLTRRFLFPNNNMDVLHSVDFDVMILLSSIMVINHLVVHLKETKDVIDYLQQLVQSDPNRGLWVISFAAFIASPFLTNDGVCLLFVEPILCAFEYTPFASELTEDARDDSKRMTLRKEDALYFLLALACSANIGSALTYTGNPQNMIVASDSLEVLPSYKFLVYMLPATLFSWVITMLYIRHCWMFARSLPVPMVVHVRSPSRGRAHSRSASMGHMRRLSSGSVHSRQSSRGGIVHLTATESGQHRREGSSQQVSVFQIEAPAVADPAPVAPSFSPEKPARTPSFFNLRIFGGDGTISKSPSHTTLSPLSPRRRKALERAKMSKRISRFVTSPFPYVVLALLGVMIVMIFIDVMPISGLICVFAILMVVTVVLGNHWRNKQIWIEEEYESTFQPMPQQASRAAQVHGTEEECKDSDALAAMETAKKEEALAATAKQEEDLGPLTREDKLDNLNQFFEELFGSIDYSLLIIFLGLFIVVENMASTGIPERIWGQIVGKAPFSTAASIAGISAFVLITSQLLGNVAVIQLAKPNVEGLDDNTKRLAWAIISFVATVGGNLTITGSAANIIVAEKAARLDSTMAIDFFRHYHVCFWVTLVSCAVGACMITAIGVADNANGSNW